MPSIYTRKKCFSLCSFFLARSAAYSNLTHRNDDELVTKCGCLIVTLVGETIDGERRRGRERRRQEHRRTLVGGLSEMSMRFPMRNRLDGAMIFIWFLTPREKCEKPPRAAYNLASIKEEECERKPNWEFDVSRQKPSRASDVVLVGRQDVDRMNEKKIND